MQIQWRHVLFVFLLLILAFYLPDLLRIVAEVVSEFSNALSSSWQAGSRGHYHNSNEVVSVVKLAVVGIIIVGIIKILSRKKGD